MITTIVLLLALIVCSAEESFGPLLAALIAVLLFNIFR